MSFNRLRAPDYRAALEQAGFAICHFEVEPATAEEHDFLRKRGLPVRATGTHIGHGMEPQFPMNIALAALAIARGKLFAPCDGSGFEAPYEDALDRVIVTSVGHFRGEGLALVEAVR